MLVSRGLYKALLYFTLLYFIRTYNAVWRNVGSLHSERDTVESDEDEDRVVEPALCDELLAESSCPARRTA